MDSIFELQFMNTDIYHLVHWFFLYSMLGWLVESVYISLCERRVVNRGFIKGPICPIYGFGALSVYFILLPIQNNYVLLYIFGALLATALEYITAVIMLKTLGSVWWDYNSKPYNYKGILCLESTVAWGFYTVIMFAFLQKFISFSVDHYTNWMGLRMGRFIACVFILYYLFAFNVKIIREKMDSVPDAIVKVQKVWQQIRKY